MRLNDRIFPSKKIIPDKRKNGILNNFHDTIVSFIFYHRISLHGTLETNEVRGIAFQVPPGSNLKLNFNINKSTSASLRFFKLNKWQTGETGKEMSDLWS